MRDTIRDWYGCILGYRDIDSNGDVTARDWYGKILGYYRKNRNQTCDISGKILYTGDCTSHLILKNVGK